MKQDAKRQFEAQVQEAMGRCVHFNGTQHTTCKAGVNIRQLVGGSDFGWGLRLPCFLRDSGKCEVTCPKREFLNREQAEKKVREQNEHIRIMMRVIAAAHDDADRKGLKKGNGGLGEMICPSGCGGKLQYVVASCNGHMHAKCTTKGCVTWIE